ncbi:MAG: AMP-binding protein [Cyclobacteriaceae bacterium]|nr:AMP-binding protein [Cyclobacteriaceae bacterium]MCH8517446.1 AMP-binding protein [Cyclobacteriaceae bacterium]
MQNTGETSTTKDYPWFGKYPAGVPKDIDPNQYESLLDLFEESFKKYADLDAYECMGKSITFRELDEKSAKFAAYLQNDSGLEKGDRVAIQMPNILQYPVAMLGVLRAGMVVVNTNPLYTAREMEHQFKDSGAKAVIIVKNFAFNLEKIRSKTGIKKVYTTGLGDMLGGLKGGIVNFVVKYIKKMVPAYNIPDEINFVSALESGTSHNYVRPELNREDIAFLQYTGGTTGVSKGAVLKHKNVIANMLQIGEWMKPRLKEKEELVITALPLYHIFALTVNCLAMLKIGAKNILITNPRDMPGFVKELGKHKFTVITGVNTLFNGLLNNPDFKSLDFSHLKIAVGGGMAVQKVVAESWEKTTGTPLAEGYGLTETSPVLTCNPIDGTEQIGTIGPPLPSTEVVILDEEGNQVKQGERGEICAKGPQVMDGYWQREEETKKVFINGYFKTGDIGVFLEDGFVKIVDRKKDMINVSGFNVYPNDVEDTVSSHPKVLEVAAIGVADEKSSEVVKLFIVKKDQSLTEQEVFDYCKENLTAYKRPKHIEFREELPKTNVGKILRRILKEEQEAKG